MRTWSTIVPAGIAGAVAALAAAVPLPPVAAFVAAVLLTLFAGAVLRARREPAAPEPGPAPPRETVEGALPSAFGRALIEKLPTPLLIISRTGRVSYANPAAHEALPRLQSGAHFASLIRAPAFVEAVGATLLDGDERRVRFSAHHGRERFFEARVGLLPPEAAFGPEALAIVQIEDRTKTRRAEQLRSDFIANASHELRTPLASIIGYIETLQHHARNDPEARERFLGIMSREAGRMQRLVDDLMSLSRIEMTEHLRPVEEWSLNQIAAECAAALLPVAERQGVTIEIDAAGERRPGARRPGSALPGVHQPDRQRDEVRRAGRGRTDLRGGAEQGASEQGRRHRRRQRTRDSARAHPAPDRALLPGERREQPQQGGHGPRARHRQAHPEPA